MADSPATTSAVVNKAAKAAGAAAAAVSETLPTVVETAQVAMEVPTKVVLNQRLIVIAAATAGVAVGAGALYGWNWFRNRGKTVIVVPNPREGSEDAKTDALDENVKTA